MFNIPTRKVRRNGLIFQVPTSIFSRFRYTVHPDGTGTSWDEGLDVDQPHGLDYRSNQDIRKGIRKRAEHEHSEFADATVGMKHLAGGCRILGIVENTVDLSTGSGDASIDITDGKFQGRGVIYDQTNNAFWCYTGDGTVSDDPYLLALHPDRAWNGGDVTWAGAHEFDASVDISGNVTIEGELYVDGTLTEFGGTPGIGLFYDPTVYAGGESVTLPNGMIVKRGSGTCSFGTEAKTFATAFPTACVGVFPTITKSNEIYTLAVPAKSKTGYSVFTGSVSITYDWFAIGY